MRNILEVHGSVVGKVWSYIWIVTVLTAELCECIQSWQEEWSPNYRPKINDNRQIFPKENHESDYFTLLHTEDQWMLIGARNRVHNISMINLEEKMRLEWEPSDYAMKLCQRKHKSEEQCQNYIRVLGKADSDTLYVCGTNAYKPKCRYYKREEFEYRLDGIEEDGVGKCPFDPAHNSTAVYADGKLFAATVADFSGRDPLIIQTKGSQMIRTEQHDSKWLNEPNYVGSFEVEDKVYFFFRETAVENINCGKAVFSRVARVCKQDLGGDMLLNTLWTSFFKARLNCSIPGDFPFDFDEIQSISLIGQGNYMSTSKSKNRTDMVYAVFGTPQNSISGSAVCAFRYSDIVTVFQGKFKGQTSALHNWLPVATSDVPHQHPEKCVNNSKLLPDNSLNFIKSHPLMDAAVPAAGGAPLLIKTGFNSRLTQISIDWQVHAADNRYYDIMFVGTDDGRVIKAINKGQGSEIETVIIEDIQVFPDKRPVVNLKIYREHMWEKLIVITHEKIVSIPLHRCHEKTSCGGCVGLQDPYCSWIDEECAATPRGIQNILEGHDIACGADIASSPPATTPPVVTTSPPLVSTSPPCHCVCPTGSQNGGDNSKPPNNGNQGHVTKVRSTARPHGSTDKPTDNVADFDIRDQNEPHSSQEGSSEQVYPAHMLAVAVVIAIVVSMVIGFLIGFKVSTCRGQTSSNRDSIIYHEEHMGSLRKNQNRHSLSMDKEPHYVNHHNMHNMDHTYAPVTKQLNYVLNVTKSGKLPNGGAETKPVSNKEVKKVYL